LSVRKWGFEAPSSQLPVAPLQAAAALDSLSAYDLTALTAPLVADSLMTVAPPVADMVARWSGEGHVILSFGDTFPSDSWQRRIWHTAGAAVVIESLPAGASTPPADSQPVGHAILAAVRSALDDDDWDTARHAAALAIRRARELQSRPDLLAVIAGIRLERDAALMISGDSLLAGSEAFRVRAAATLVALDRRLHALRRVRALIGAAGAAPRGVSTLAEWARDSALPLAVRDEMIRAIGFGWLLDPPEMSFGLDSTRVTALQGLAGADLPPELRQTVKAVSLGSPGVAQRFNLSISYRTKRLESLDL
jgi:hypothetical protein